MDIFIEYLNINSGFVMAISTAVYAIFTLFILFSSIRSNGIVKKQNKLLEMQNKKTIERYENETKARIIVSTADFMHDGIRKFFLILTNIGLKPAYNIKIKLQDEYYEQIKEVNKNNDYKLSTEYLPKHKFNIEAKGRRIITLYEVDKSIGIIEKNTYEVYVTYNDLPIEKHKIDLFYVTPLDLLKK